MKLKSKSKNCYKTWRLGVVAAQGMRERGGFTMSSMKIKFFSMLDQYGEQKPHKRFFVDQKEVKEELFRKEWKAYKLKRKLDNTFND